MDDSEAPSDEDVMRHVEEQEQLRRATDRSFVKKCVGWFFAILVITGLILIAPSMCRTKKPMRGTQALSNSKQVYLVLLDFESDHGYFPDDASAASDPSLSRFKGSHSNDYLGQLIEGGYIKSEEIFYAYDKRYKLRPDEVISPSTSILEKNECGFSYVMVEENGTVRGMRTKDHSELPILLAPLTNEWGSFEKNSYEKKGVYLRVDGSARIVPLRNSDQKIKLSSGKTLLESGSGTMWGNVKPVVLLPDR
jgi:hypothetical protein